MTQQRKIRPTRAERARQKTRVPNLPQGGAASPRPIESSPARDAGVAPAAAPTLAAAAPRAPVRIGSGMIQDYSYVRTDLVRIAAITGLLLVVMFVLALIER